MRHKVLILAVLLTGIVATLVAYGAGADQPAHFKLAAAKTGKERLSDKGSDEQRLDDCKVPEARRTKARPANCRDER